MKAKDLSLFAIAFALVWVAALTLAKAIAPVLADGRALGLTMPEIVTSGVFFVVACSPVYRSIWLDKKLGIKSGVAPDALDELPAATDEELKEQAMRAVAEVFHERH